MAKCLICSRKVDEKLPHVLIKLNKKAKVYLCPICLLIAIHANITENCKSFTDIIDKVNYEFTSLESKVSEVATFITDKLIEFLKEEEIS